MKDILNSVILGDCLIESNLIEDSSVDLILTDLPYGVLQPNHNGKAYKQFYGDKTRWDFAIEPSEIFKIANRILRKNGKMILFSQEPYTSKLISSAIPSVPFSYKMIWKKDTFGSHLKCNIAPLGFFEEILVFTKPNPKLDYKKANPLRDIMLKYVDEYGKDYIIDLFIKEGRYSSETSARVHAAHKFGFNKGARFDFLDKKMFNYLSEFIDFKETYDNLKTIYTEYKTKQDEELNLKYPNTFNLKSDEKYKSNVLEYKKDKEGLHPTQKPIALLEDLINTYTNKGELVVDLTSGSSSTAIASINTNRNFICIEKDEEYYEKSLERIKLHKEFKSK